MNFRQIQAILHSWFGIIVLWVIFFIFLTGSIAYFRTEINVWAQPEVLSQTEKIPSTQHSAQIAFNYLKQTAPDAKRWRVTVANERMPVNVLEWQDQDGKYQKLQDPNTGKLLEPVRNTLAGDFFFKLHYTLYPLPSKIGSSIVAIVSLILLISLITGVITHKKIIKEFFVFRAFKGQRSLLDLHHITGVITFPFYLMMAFTGLLILFYLVLPWGLSQQYGKAGIPQFYNEMQFLELAKPKQSQSSAAIMQPIESFIKKIPETTESGAILDKFEVQKPNTAEAMITFEYNYKNIITLNTPQYIFSANTVELLAQPRNLSAIAQLASSSYGIHLGYFASNWIRFILAIMGVVGCVMLAAGALLWQKKRLKEQYRFSYKLIQHLNCFTFLGLPLACASYLLAGRLLPAAFEPRGSYEVSVFYLTWLLSLLISLVLSTRATVILLLTATVAVLFLIPLSSFVMVPEASLWQSITHSRWSLAGVDLSCLLIGMLYIGAIHFYLSQYQPAGAPK
ncbi:PepSY domain-containing protein [Acinetobacter dispersus]|uniref:PepSY-associated TM helix domain-containing protein n=1 Tax=Acinetobacter dispersus TaxID=70348 RepID=UPI00132E83EB|nr:PepSY-associated TM helix domain-containing protein [Acinetobacter dispersus]MCH7383278.1 PepSY domain-containing protein [Acinetobacter dispersus]QHH97093.1 PepSY domain-containing protein [Acinetobacter dispersus]